MLAKDRDGKSALVDLTLERSGGALVPRNPQSRVRIASRLDGGVRFSRSDWGLRLTDRAVTGTLVANKVFAANAVGEDTDVVVEPTPGGVEVSHVLRSKRSPQSISIGIDVPEGGSVRFERVSGGAGAQQVRPVVVADAKGKPVGRVLPPSAVDAQGTPVDVATERSIPGSEASRKSKSDGLWWARDQARHGGSAWKVYQETPTGLRWYRDADRYGDFITAKHKGDVGKFIPWKEFGGR